MEIAAVFGSPRKNGNSATLAETFLAVMEPAGARVRRIHLRRLRYSGCIACNACKRTAERCVLDDGLTAALEAVRAADAVLIATPVYFYDVPSQLKAFLDRWYAFFKPNYFARPDASRLPPGKTGILLVAQRAPESYFFDAAVRLAHLLRRFGFGEIHGVRGGGLGDAPDAAARRGDLLARTRAAARRVLAGEPADPPIPPYDRMGGYRPAG
jgi:NAD(P)H-dependent FMN reductase